MEYSFQIECWNYSQNKQLKSLQEESTVLYYFNQNLLSKKFLSQKNENKKQLQWTTYISYI